MLDALKGHRDLRNEVKLIKIQQAVPYLLIVLKTVILMWTRRKKKGESEGTDKSTKMASDVCNFNADDILGT